MKVIICDDNKDLADCLREYLTINGFEVLGIGHDGKTGAELYKKMNPDFILLDYNMPEYDGVYAINSIKEYDRSAKIFMLTGSADDHEELRRLKVAAIFSKPVDIDNMVKEIQFHLQEKLIKC